MGLLDIKAVLFNGSHILLSGYACQHCERLPPDFDLNQPLFHVAFSDLFLAFERIRAAVGHPIPITSGYRCRLHDMAVAGKGVPYGPHAYGVALDLGCESAAAVQHLHDIARRVWPDLRIGWRSYIAAGDNHLHIDTAYHIFPRPTTDYIRGVEW